MDGSDLFFVIAFLRISDPGMDSKVIFKNYARMPMLTTNPDGVVSVVAGDACDSLSVVDSDPPSDVEEGSASSKVSKVLSVLLPVALGNMAGLPGTLSAGLGLVAFGASDLMQVSAQDVGDIGVEACDIVPIDVEIYVGTTSDEIVMREFQSGDFETCPPESKLATMLVC